MTTELTQTDLNSDEPIEYEQFRTGLTYGDVYHMIYSRKWKRRNGVLGYWKQLKKEMYKEYVAQFWYEKERVEQDTR